MKNQDYLVINFWDVKNKAAQTLLINGNKTLTEAFIKKYESEKLINETENRMPEKDKLPTWMKIAILVIIVSILIMIFV